MVSTGPMHLVFLLATIPVLLLGGSAIDPPARTDVPPPPLPTGCFLNSVLNPLWEISQLQHNDTSLSLVLANPADQSVFYCAGTKRENSNLIQPACETDGNHTAANVTLLFNPSLRNLSIDQTWICTDNQHMIPTTFHGTGNTSLISSCPEASCLPATEVRVYASLRSPVSLSPVMPPPPPGHDHPGCKRASGSPTWTVSGFRWDTGAVPVYNPDLPIQQYRPGYALHLGLINPATGQNMTCVQTIGTWAQANQSGSPYELPFWGPEKPLWQECVDTRETNQYINNYNTWTNVLLDPDTRRLYVDQTWYCDDEGPEHPIQYTANGSVPIPPLHCVPRTSLDEFDPFTNVVVNGSTCTADSPFPVSGTLVSEYTMAPYALTLPRPAAKRCTADSLNPDLRYIRLYAPLQFEYRSYKTLRDGEGLVAGRLEFLLWNVGQDTELACDGWNGRLNSNASIGQYDPDYWFDCREELDVGQSTEDPNRLRTRYARVNFDVGASLLRVNISWTCDDESPGRNVTFEALSEAKLPTLNCTVADAGTEDEATLCTWPDRWKSQDLPMPFVSFRAY